MSDDRIPCQNCGALILEVTAQHNEGFCAPCKSSRDYALLQRRQQEARRHAPPPSINYSGFTKKEFIRGLAEACLPHRADPKKVSVEFLGFCDPILDRSSGFSLFAILFYRRELYTSLKRVPRPYRELMAVYQAWGMMSSDGFESYLGNITAKFDHEVDRGLTLLGQETAKGVISKARKACKTNGGEIRKEIDEDVWRRFYRSMDDFQSEILGKRLIFELPTAEAGRNGD